jgi:periplasmic protein TonB
MKFLPILFTLLTCLAFNQLEAQSNSRMDDATFTFVEQMPEFPGCESETDKTIRKDCAFNKLITYLSKNLHYPEAAKAAITEGTCIVSFVIDKNGSVTKVQLKEGFDTACDAEALRVIQQMPKWNPGVQDGQQVAVHMVLPIRFSL